ncbi:MAG TPA: tetratricopeptide repeat protein [Acidobacteriaceae bacterium]|jgi:tetratricopeptide (TPR) repeat protein|nr:tetratricopeptide repeat protein [Acidobacteriaceae bacterium]
MIFKIRHAAVCGLMVVLCSPAARLSAQGTEEEQQLSEAGQQALTSGHYDEAERNFTKLAELDPQIAEIHATLGLVYFQEKKFEQAVPELRRALKLKPTLGKASTLLAMSLSETGEYQEALPGLEKGFQHAPDPATKRMCGLQLMRSYTGLQRDQDAVKVALELDELYPNDPEILYHTGRVYGNYAFLTMHKLEVAAPASVWRHQAAAEAFESEGSTNQAIGEYHEVLKLDPQRVSIHYRIGRTLLARWKLNHAAEDRDQAVREFEQELQVDPSNANALYELAEIHRQQNELDQAQQFFSSALKYYPDFEEAQVGLATTLMAQQKPDLALPHLQKAVTLNAGDEVAWYRLSQVNRALGNKDEQQKALVQFQRVRSQQAQQQGTTPPGEVTKQVLQNGEVQ